MKEEIMQSYVSELMCKNVLIKDSMESEGSKYAELLKKERILRDQMTVYRRKYLHLSQVKVAKICGMNNRTVSHCEVGDIRVNAKLLIFYVENGFDIKKALNGEYKEE